MIGVDIKVNNFEENESVNYRLILIKGSIIKDNAVCNNLNGNIDCKANGVSTTWPVFNGDFKCLAQLTCGENDVMLEYEGICKCFKVNFIVHETDHCVVPIYLIPDGHEGTFQAPKGIDNSISSAVQKIGFGMFMIQTMFAEKLRERDYNRKSFQLEVDIDKNAPFCREFRSRLSFEKAKSLNEEELWEEIGRELMMSELGSVKKKFICFISSTFWDGKTVITDPALGGGGLALLGSGSIHSWPASILEVVRALTDNRKLESSLLDNSCFRGTYSGVFATSLGSAAHEIGHIFNLGHTRNGLMSRGFDHTHLVFIQTSTDEKRQYEELVPCLSVSNGPAVKKSESIIVSSTRYQSSNSDLTYLESGCAAILAYHKWFNPTFNEVMTNICYDKLRHVIVSDAGLRVVEVRGANGAVRRSWILRGSGKHLVIPTGHAGATLIAIDSNGTILTDTV